MVAQGIEQDGKTMRNNGWDGREGALETLSPSQAVNRSQRRLDKPSKSHAYSALVLPKLILPWRVGLWKCDGHVHNAKYTDVHQVRTMWRYMYVQSVRTMCSYNVHVQMWSTMWSTVCNGRPCTMWTYAHVEVHDKMRNRFNELKKPIAIKCKIISHAQRTSDDTEATFSKNFTAKID